MKERLEAIEERYNYLSNELTKTEILSDFKLMTEYSKEQKSLEEIVNKYKELNDAKNEIVDLKELINDSEMGFIAREEIETLNEKIVNINKELEILLIPKDPNDGKNVIMEIRGAAGGDEANIFAGDLFKMYSRYAEKNNWKIEIINAEEGTSGGYSQIEFIIKGDNVYSKLKYESGSHRVQRVPDTETQGRVHTSTSTVAVLPQMEFCDIEVKEADLKMDVYHSSGAGGQSVNTSNSAVRLTHIPTGVVVTCQTERSQLKNRNIALELLKSKIHEEQVRKAEEAAGTERRNKIGTGDRSEKIRTYNYPQNRITDHRINFSYMDLEKVMNGYLDPIIETLITEDQKLKMAGK